MPRLHRLNYFSTKHFIFYIYCISDQIFNYIYIMQEATKKTTQEIVDVLTTSDYSKKFKLMTTTAVEKFTKVVGHVLLRDFIAYNDIDLSGVNQRRLLVKLKEHCEYHRYFTEKYVEIKFDKKSLHDFFETYDNAALIELTKKIERPRRLPKAQTENNKVINDIIVIKALICEDISLVITNIAQSYLDAVSNITDREFGLLEDFRFRILEKLNIEHIEDLKKPAVILHLDPDAYVDIDNAFGTTPKLTAQMDEIIKDRQTLHLKAGKTLSTTERENFREMGIDIVEDNDYTEAEMDAMHAHEEEKKILAILAENEHPIFG